VWLLGSAACAVLLLRLSGFAWPIIVVGLLASASLLNYQLGQFGVITGAIFLASIRLGERWGFWRNIRDKPQLGLLLPFRWLSQSNLRALAGFMFVMSASFCFRFACSEYPPSVLIEKFV